MSIDDGCIYCGFSIENVNNYNRHPNLINKSCKICIRNPENKYKQGLKDEFLKLIKKDGKI
jgi:hypothetical protein